MQAQVQELTLEQVEEAVNAILSTLGHPETDAQEKAQMAFNNKDYQTVKRLASTNLSDNYIKSLGYLGGAFKLTPNTDTILAEAARSACEHVKERTLHSLSECIAKALGEV